MTTTYQQLLTENLLSLNFTSISSNFRTIDSFIKNFSSFQRKFSQLQKHSRQTSQDLINFKLSTQNTFSTISDMLESRQGSKQDPQQLNDIRKQIKQLKSFIAQSTQSTLSAQQQTAKQALQRDSTYKQQISSLMSRLQQTQSNLITLNNSVVYHANNSPTIAQHHQVSAVITDLNKILAEQSAKTQSISEMLDTLNVSEFKEILNSTVSTTQDSLASMRGELKKKVDTSELIKLQDMILNHIQYVYENVGEKYATKSESKKALVFLEKRINQVYAIMTPTQESIDDGLITIKKCISCSKELNEYEGKLDKVKWSNVPIKDSMKEKILLDTTPGKIKGNVNNIIEIQDKIQAKSLFRVSQSRLPSPQRGKNMETNYMGLFGRNQEKVSDLREEYFNKQRGVEAYKKKQKIYQ